MLDYYCKNMSIYCQFPTTKIAISITGTIIISEEEL